MAAEVRISSALVMLAADKVWLSPKVLGYPLADIVTIMALADGTMGYESLSADRLTDLMARNILEWAS